jgi:hypothetical protein
MSFFTTSTGEQIQSTGSFEAGGGDFTPIPKDTRVLASCVDAKIDSYEGQQSIKLKWQIMQPSAHAKRVIFQKLAVFDADPTKKDKALRMLAAIDANAGGKLAASGATPTDMTLMQALSNRTMVLMLDVWEMNGKTGNWVKAVSKAQGATSAAHPAPAPKPSPAPVASFDDDDDIPF